MKVIIQYDDGREANIDLEPDVRNELHDLKRIYGDESRMFNLALRLLFTRRHVHRESAAAYGKELKIRSEKTKSSNLNLAMRQIEHLGESDARLLFDSGLRGTL